MPIPLTRRVWRRAVSKVFPPEVVADRGSLRLPGGRGAPWSIHSKALWLVSLERSNHLASANLPGTLAPPRCTAASRRTHRQNWTPRQCTSVRQRASDPVSVGSKTSHRQVRRSGSCYRRCPDPSQVKLSQQKTALSVLLHGDANPRLYPLRSAAYDDAIGLPR